jgi:predicted metalloprotease with PDZ domain
MSTVQYTVRFPAPHTHYAEIEAIIPVTGPSAELFMAVWTPGSYLIREYSRHVEAVTANGLPLEKTAKNRWRVETGGAAEIRVNYRIYCREMSVRTNWVEDSYALINGAPTFLTLARAPHLTYNIRLELPPHWTATASGMTELAPHHYFAPDYDTLVDSPILAGNPRVYEFYVDGIPHQLVNLHEEGVWDGTRSAQAAERIVRQYREFWGSLPYSKYVFLNLLTETYGGLEHKNSMVIMSSRWKTRTPRAWLEWLGLLSHEFLHVWNVKRLRPAELGPFDYEAENYTKSLWISEGFTNYYDALTVHRAGLSSREEYLGENGLSGLIQQLQTTPGRLVSSVAQSSYDSWIKLYRPDENSVNTTISYYTKGAVVGWLLDALIRKSTRGAKSLDHLMRLAFERCSGDRGFTPEQFEATAEEVAGIPLREFFRRSVESTEELDYTEALDWFGLRFRPAPLTGKAWMGAETKNDAGRLVVSKIPRGTPAHDSGLNVDDEILAIDAFRVRADQLSQRLENYALGNRVSLLIARREKLSRVEVTLTAEPAKQWQLEVRPDATDAQKSHLARWLA